MLNILSKMYERKEITHLHNRIKEPRRHIQVVVGPRQVGKTTMVSQLYKKLKIPAMFESADAVSAVDKLWLNQIWEAARLKIKTTNAGEFVLIVDEIQKINNWSETVKRLWDEDTRNEVPLKIILLGSSRLLVQEGLTESLAGRFESIYLTHWSYEEMSAAFGWDGKTYAWFGGYPGGAGLIDDEKRWKNYIKDSLIETSVSKDILMLTRIEKPALLKNLFELGCTYSGQILSYTKMLGQLQDAGNTTTLSHYLRLLDTAGLLCGLEKYASSVIRKKSSSPKFQVYNNALLSVQSNRPFKDMISNLGIWGRMVESTVGAHLINYAIKENFNVHYWRERNEEVDFVLEKKDQVVAIEVKSGLVRGKKGMNTFVKKFNPSKIYLVDNKTLKWEEFIKINPEQLF